MFGDDPAAHIEERPQNDRARRKSQKSAYGAGKGHGRELAEESVRGSE